MTLEAMRYALGELLDANTEERYTLLNKLRRLNLAQEQLVSEMVSGLPPERVRFLPLPLKKATLAPEATPLEYFTLPTDFLYPVSVSGEQSDYRFIQPGAAVDFPYDGSQMQPIVYRDGQKAYLDGRLHDETLTFWYYRFPREMKYDGQEDMEGNTYDGDNIDCELPGEFHGQIVLKAFQITDMAEKLD